MPGPLNRSQKERMAQAAAGARANEGGPQAGVEDWALWHPPPPPPTPSAFYALPPPPPADSAPPPRKSLVRQPGLLNLRNSSPREAEEYKYEDGDEGGQPPPRQPPVNTSNARVGFEKTQVRIRGGSSRRSHKRATAKRGKSRRSRTKRGKSRRSRNRRS